MKVRRTTAAGAAALALVALTVAPPAGAAARATSADPPEPVVVHGVGALAVLTPTVGLGIGGTSCASPEPWQIGSEPLSVDTTEPGTPLGSAVWATGTMLPRSA